MLRYKEDVRTISFLALYFISYICIWFFVPFNWWAILLSTAWLCALNFIIAITIHNTIHCPIFKNKKLNKLYQILLSIAFGSPASGFVPGHNLSHHKHLQTPKDNARTNKMRFKCNLLNQALFFFVMIPNIVKTEQSFVKHVGKKKRNWYRQYQIETWIMWTWRVIWLIIDWRKFLVYLIVPNYYAVWGIFGTNYWQHDGCDENHPYNHSRNFTNKFFNFLVCNNGYHGAHHDKPGLHWSLYPAYHEKYIRPFIHPSLDRVSLFAYLWKSCIYPAKRIDYLGNPIATPPKIKDEDWVKETKIELITPSELGAEI